MPRPLYLIGFMGAGKTTLGRALEARLPGWRYVDLDDEVERRAGMSVSKIFALHGEGVFRRMERAELLATTAMDRVIVGCGGGTPCYYDNIETMNGAGTTVLLRASTPVLLRRLLEAQAQRPKLKGFDAAEVERYIVAEQAAREVHYSKAMHVFPSDRLESPAEIEVSCRMFLRMFAPQIADDNR